MIRHLFLIVAAMVAGGIGVLACLFFLQPESLRSKFERTREGMMIWEVEAIFGCPAHLEGDANSGNPLLRNNSKYWFDGDGVAAFWFTSDGEVYLRGSPALEHVGTSVRVVRFEGAR